MISGSGTLYGDGMAMWLTKQRAQGGDVFGFMDKFEGLGIFIDTYKNNRPGVVFPYVMAMLGDGTTAYDKENDGKANELAGCSVRPPSPQSILPTTPGTKSLHATGSRNPQPRLPHKTPPHLLPRQIPKPRPPIQSRRPMAQLLQARRRQDPLGSLPRVHRRNRRTLRQPRHHLRANQKPVRAYGWLVTGR
jgi:hypothetical protein